MLNNEISLAKPYSMEYESNRLEMISASSKAQSVYGYTSATLDSWCNYGYALMIIAGADGVVSEKEMDFLIKDFAGRLSKPEKIEPYLRRFDYKNESLEPLLKRISFYTSVNHRITLLYDAIRMARADADYAREEQQAVENASKILGIDPDIALTLEGLVDMELAVIKSYEALFELNTPAYRNIHPPGQIVMEIIDTMPDPARALLNYGKALLVIANADGEVSEKELMWFFDDFAKLKNAGQPVLNKLHAFDYQNADPVQVLSGIPDNAPLNFTRVLLYDSIRMARADYHYAFEEEKAVKEAARILKVRLSTAMALERLVETEEMVARLRKTLFFNNDV